MQCISDDAMRILACGCTNLDRETASISPWPRLFARADLKIEMVRVSVQRPVLLLHGHVDDGQLVYATKKGQRDVRYKDMSTGELLSGV